MAEFRYLHAPADGKIAFFRFWKVRIKFKVNVQPGLHHKTRAVEPALNFQAPAPICKRFWLRFRLQNDLGHCKLKAIVLFVQLACPTKIGLWNRNSYFRLRLQHLQVLGSGSTALHLTLLWRPSTKMNYIHPWPTSKKGSTSTLYALCVLFGVPRVLGRRKPSLVCPGEPHGWFRGGCCIDGKSTAVPRVKLFLASTD